MRGVVRKNTLKIAQISCIMLAIVAVGAMSTFLRPPVKNAPVDAASYNVTYDANGGTLAGGGTTTTASIAEGTEFTLPSVTRTGYTGTWQDKVLLSSPTGTAINSIAGLKAVSGSGQYYLTCDIDLANEGSWTPLCPSTAFTGTLDGQGYSIKNMKITSTTLQYVGLFGRMNGIVKNLKLENINISCSYSSATNYYVGGIAGYSTATTTNISNCTVSGTIKSINTYTTSGYSYTYNYTGGIIGNVTTLTCTNCINNADIKATASGGATSSETKNYAYSGGIAGYVGSSGTFSDCKNTGTLVSVSTELISTTWYGNCCNIYSGGIVGYSNNATTLSRCSNSGDISGTVELLMNPQMFSDDCNIGGLIGYMDGGGVISNSYNTGNLHGLLIPSITSTTYSYVYFYIGGAVGYLDYNKSNITMINVYNSGSISCSKETREGGDPTYTWAPYLGGLLGKCYFGNNSSGFCKFYNCYNIGDIITPSFTEAYLGGILSRGDSMTGTSSVFNNVFNAGNIIDEAVNDASVTQWARGAYFTDSPSYFTWTNCYQNNESLLTIKTPTANPSVALMSQPTISLNFVNNYTDQNGASPWRYDASVSPYPYMLMPDADLSGAPGEKKVFNSLGNHVITAQWTPNRYNVAYNSNGGSGTMATVSHTYDTAQNLSANAFTRAGYEFLGWSTDKNATAATYTNSQNVVNLTATNGATVTLYAVWKALFYTINYNMNFDVSGAGSASNFGEMSAETAMMTVNHTLAANGYMRNGYTFLGWSKSASATTPTYTDKAGVLDLGVSGETVNLYAVWAKNNYTITLNANGGGVTGATGWSLGSDGVTFEATKGYMSTITLPTPTRSGYLFRGWVPTVTRGGDTYYEVFYQDSQGGSVLFSGENEAKSTNSQYKFSLLSDMGTLNQDATAYTYWLEYEHIAGYNNWSQTDNPTETYVSPGATHTVPGYTPIAISWAGNYFGGMQLQNTVECYLSGTIGVTSWYYALGTCVAYNAGMPTTTQAGFGVTYPNGAMHTENTSYGVRLFQKAVDLSGNFAKNLSQLQGGDTCYFRNENVTLTALWEQNTYTVQFNGNGAGNTMATRIIEFGKGATITNEFVWSKHAFLGWAKTADAPIPQYPNGFNFDTFDFAGVDASKSITLYAIWIELPTAVTGIAVSATKGGTVLIVGDDFDTLPNDAEITLRANVCLDNYGFKGWYYADDLEGNAISTDTSLRITKSKVYQRQIMAVFVELNNSNVNTDGDNQ